MALAGTSFTWTMAMRRAFPTSSALLVSQAVGHIVAKNDPTAFPGSRDDSSYISDWKKTDGKCTEYVSKFWGKAELPPDGTLCVQDGPVT